jgi:pyruvate dehydrogenase E2 component (dihydrolipoamide acetyltransferase)
MSGNEFLLPDLGEGLHDAEIVQWHVAPGDHVVADQPLVAVETDKAVVEIPAPRAGRIARLGAAEGERIVVGQVLVTFAAEAPADRGSVVGELPGAPAAPTPAPPATRHEATMQHLRASPAARRLARELRFELETITGSGPDGVISVADVQRAAQSLAPPPAQPAWESLHGPRRAMAERMAAAHAAVVPASVTLRARVRAWHGRERPLLRLMRALLHACAAEPALNCWFDTARQALLRHDTVNLGLAVDTPEGLFVPVIAGADRLDDAALLAAATELREAVASRSITPERLRDATITLSNFGAIGGETAQMVVAPPQVAILGAGRIAPEVVVREGLPAVEPVLPLSLTFDHRAVTGGEAARFLAAVRAHLEQESGA